MSEKSKEDLVREWNKLKEEEEKKRLKQLIKEKKFGVPIRKNIPKEKKSPIDQIFDKLTAREHIILEALGFLNDDSEYKGFAVHQLICGQIRNAQDELKEQYPRLKELK